MQALGSYSQPSVSRGRLLSALVPGRGTGAANTLSRRFNSLLTRPAGYVDPNPLTGYRRDTFGNSVPFRLLTAIMYAEYVLHTAMGR